MENLHEPLLSMRIPLPISGEENDGEFHTQNASNDDWERRNIIERTHDVIHIRCDLVEVVHGWLDQQTKNETGPYGTLVVFRFRFDAQKHSRRLLRARINVEFFSAGQTRNDGDSPEVIAIAPEERWSVAPTIDHDWTSMGGELHVGATCGVGPAVTGIGKLQKTASRDITDATTVTGSINLGSGRNSGESNTAVWTLLENKTRGTGLPDSIKVAVLLKREDDQPFNAMVTLEAEADLKTRVGSLFKQRVPIDDPILFNPRVPRERRNQNRRLGAQNLGSTDLYSLCEVRMAPEAFFAKTVSTQRKGALADRLVYTEDTL